MSDEPAWTAPGGTPENDGSGAPAAGDRPPGAPGPPPAPGRPPEPERGTPVQQLPHMAPYPMHPGYGVLPPEPGIVPLRPLDLGTILGGSFKLLRFNPRATVVLSLVAQLVAVGIVVPLVLWVISQLDSGTQEAVGSVTASFGGNAGQILTSVITVVVGLVLVVVVGRSVLGERVSVGRAWEQARPSLWPYLGLTLASGLVGLLLVGAPVALGFLVSPWFALLLLPVLPLLLFLGVRLHFAASAIVLERLGVVAGLRRSWALTRGAFWRILGISLLGALVVGLVASVVSTPLSLVGVAVSVATTGLEDVGETPVALVVSTILASAIATGLTAPVSTAISTLLYIDQRMRTEGFDVTLTRAAAARLTDER